MLEILLIVLALVLAAKKPVRRRRSMSGYRKGKVNEQLSLGTLAATTLISAAFGEVLLESARITSIVSTYALKDITIAAGDGPITVGVAHGDYTSAEVEEVLENTGSWAAGNLVAKEIANRKVRVIGTFDFSGANAADIPGSAVLNEGRPIKTKLNWFLRTGQTLQLWAYNEGDSALAGTDPTLHMIGHANIFDSGK